MNEHFVDLFCGAGGSGTGVLEAYARLGRKPSGTFVNHWERAIQIHELNHPEHRHFPEDLFLLEPDTVFPADSNVSMLWASPSCVHFSVARGDRPLNEQDRSHASNVLKWVRHLRPDVLLVENVKEFRTWGPLMDVRRADGTVVQKADPDRKNEYFDAWLAELDTLGYECDHRVLCSADYGDPTIRKRLFVQCVRRDTGRHVVWPKPTHGPARADGTVAKGLKPWVCARDIIDWSDEGESIFTRKRPLSAKTMKRIAIGLVKYGLKDFMVPQQQGHQCDYTRSVDAPVSGLTATARGEGLARPYVVQVQGTSTACSADAPVTAVQTKQKHALAQPFCVKLKGTGTAVSMEEPVHTVGCAMHHAFVNAFMMALDQAGKDGANHNTYPVDSPVKTVTTKANQTVAKVELTPFTVQTAHEGSCETRVRDLMEPLLSVCGNRGDAALVRPWIYTYYSSGSEGSPADSPMPTVRTKQGTGLCWPVLEMNGQMWLLDIRFRMLRVKELSRAQGFPDDYKWTGTLTEQVRAIGNSVTRRLARALGLAVLTQNENITEFHKDE